jgi:hypothetical protein
VNQVPSTRKVPSTTLLQLNGYVSFLLGTVEFIHKFGDFIWHIKVWNGRLCHFLDPRLI